MRPTRLSAIALSAALVVLLASCSSSSAAPAATTPGHSAAAHKTHKGAPPSPSPSQSNESPSFALKTHGTIPFSDSQGYTFTLSYSLSTGPMVPDTTNAPPSFTDYIAPVNASGELKNTTSGGRTAPVSSDASHFVVLAFYPLSSPLCTMKDKLGETLPQYGEGTSATYCGLKLAELAAGGGNSISSGASIPLGLLHPAQLPGGQVLIREYPETPSLLDAANTPAVAFGMFNSSFTPSKVCPLNSWYYNYANGNTTMNETTAWPMPNLRSACG